MNKKILIILFIVIIVISLIVYIIVANTNKEEQKSNNTENKQEDVETALDSENEYKSIDINSVLADEIYKFIPKYFPGPNMTIDNEYITYSSIFNLKNKDSNSMNINDIYEGYSYNDVLKEAKVVFGKDTTITKQDKYNFPMKYNQEFNAFYLEPFGFGGMENLQSIKSLEENNDKFIMTIYAVNIEHDMDNDTNAYIATKDTFKLYNQNETNQEKLYSSMKKYKIYGIDLDVSSIINEYNDVLPLIEYELIKLDNSKYYVSSIKAIY